MSHLTPSASLLAAPSVLASWVLAALLVVMPAQAQSPANPLDTAQAHWFAGRQVQAVDTLQAAIAADANQSRWRFTLAWMRQERGERAAAEVLLQRLVEDFPDYAEAHNNLAVIQAGRGDLDAAFASLTRSVLLQPDQNQAQENLGDVLLRMAQRAYAKSNVAQPQSRLQLKLSQLDALLRPVP